ncbi:dynein beta chain, ciliary-like [Nerophis ophidion]|uniref:dynein beta chain, ciliary-like n=1 Tax=Nerophis ophidion TaxID=159077 RepID=UPI002ADFD584|nr:dynein beta chain, ciliary-like [Nerophis ophidion]
MEILRRVKSSYYSSFQEICVKVDEALLEAEDVDLHLRPLRRLITNLEERSFPQVDTLLPPLFHSLCLIWSHSRFYCTAQRMVVLLQEFCNLILDKAFAYLIPQELFKMELEEGQERVQISISVLRTFKQLFHTHRQKILGYFQHNQTVKLWDFPASLVFRRSDRVLERLLMMQEMFAAALDFLKLEKIQVGGSRGKVLSEMVSRMSEEFHEGWRALRESKYDPLDYSDPVFVHQHQCFMEQNRAFEQRLGTLLNLFFHSSNNLKSTKKLLQLFGNLLERPRIHQLFSANDTVLLDLFKQEVEHLHLLLHQHRDESGSVCLGNNLPPVAGRLKWSQELQSRILSNRSNLSQMPLGGTEADATFRKCERLLENLEQQDQELLSGWTEGLEEVCQRHLKDPLLTFDTNTGLFHLNFSPALTSVLREVKYLRMLNRPNIPQAALHLHSKRERIYLQSQTLTLVTQWYNQLQSTILDVERGLLQDQLDKVRRQLDPALRELTWAQDDPWDYIKSTQDLVQSIWSRVRKSKANLQAIQDLLGGLSGRACVSRTSGDDAPLMLSDIDASVAKQHALISSTGKQVHTLLQDNLSLLGVADVSSGEWRAYLDHVDQLVLSGLCGTTRCSLRYLLDNTHAARRIAPLFELRLVLNDHGVCFDPPLDCSHTGNFLDLVDKMVDDIINQASFIPRVARHTRRDDYQSDVNQMKELSEMCWTLRSRARAATNKVREYEEALTSYQYLWTDDRSDFLRQFVLCGRMLSTEEAELHHLKKNPPTLENFKEQIHVFKSLHERVSQMEERKVFCGWLLLDLRPFKCTLMNVIKRRSWMLKEHLLDHVKQRSGAGVQVCFLTHFL